MARAPLPRPDPYELERRLTGRVDVALREVDEVVDRPRSSPEALHRLHRELRRLRVGLEIGRRAAPNARASELRGYERRLKHLARLVGGVRDRDVALALLGTSTEALSAGERGEVRDLRSHLVEDARVGRELVRAALRTERDCGLFEGIRRSFSTGPSPRRAAELGRYLARVEEEGRAAVREAHRRAQRRPNPRRLHQLRIRVRSWRQLADLARPFDDGPTSPAPRPLRALQARLGRLHDLDVVEDLARGGAPETLARALRQQRERERRRVVRQLRSGAWQEVVALDAATA